MTEKYRGIYFPPPSAGGSAGQCLSARSSVPIDLCFICNTAAGTPQANSTSGFYARSAHAVGDVSSTLSGFCFKPKASPTVVRIRSQLCAELSLRDASTLHFLTGVEQSTPSPNRASSPLRGLVPPAETCPAAVFYSRGVA